MKLLLLGTTGYHPNDRRQTACFMLPELGVVLDAGTGFYRVRDHLRTKSLDVFLSHVHLDHVIGLTYLFDVLHERDVRRVRAFVAPDKIPALRDHLLVPDLFPADLPVDFEPLGREVPLADGGVLTTFGLEHPGGCLGFRLDWPGRSLAYVTDTTADVNAAYVERIRGVNVLLHECNFPDGWESLARQTGHSCTTPVAQVARAAEVGRLVLVHVNPLSSAADPVGLSAAQAIFPKTTLGEDGMEIEVP